MKTKYFTTFVQNTNKMDAKQQCCSLEQSKKLKELGVMAEPLYYWNTFFNTSSTKPNTLFTMLDTDNQTNIDDWGDEKSYIKNHSWYPAYTVSELAIALANCVDFSKNIRAVECLEKYGFYGFDKTNMFSTIYSPSYLADCLIHLLEHNILTADEVNASINA